MLGLPDCVDGPGGLVLQLQGFRVILLAAVVHALTHVQGWGNGLEILCMGAKMKGRRLGEVGEGSERVGTKEGAKKGRMLGERLKEGKC